MHLIQATNKDSVMTYYKLYGITTLKKMWMQTILSFQKI
jgi:hypothetical protein